MPKKRKSYPAVTSLWFKLQDGDRYIDLGQALSLMNRRLYRQGMKYYVDSFELVAASAGASGTAYVDIDCIPNTWMSENAWQKGFGIWKKMSNEAAEQMPDSAKARYTDFKVFFDEVHYVAGTGSGSTLNLVPTDAGGAVIAVTNAEWSPSQIVLPQTVSGSASATEYALKFLGADSGTANSTLATDGSRTLIQGYASTRVSTAQEGGEPPLPGDASTNWMNLVFDDGDTHTDIINHIEAHNDKPPYATASDPEAGDNPIYPGGSESFVNGQIMAKMRFNLANQTGAVYAQGGEVLGGLLKVGSNTTDVWLRVNLAPGTYKGVAALPIGV